MFSAHFHFAGEQMSPPKNRGCCLMVFIFCWCERGEVAAPWQRLRNRQIGNDYLATKTKN
jgi:hypothetical protein